MSPPEIWGPAVWTLFHTLSEKMHPTAYTALVGSTFSMFKQICKALPCPECSNDANNFLAKINIQHYKTKEDFKLMLYLFHNYVNQKKRKPMFNYSQMNRYAKFNPNSVVQHFLNHYHTKGNMKLLTDSFQRKFIVTNFLSWYRTNYLAFNLIRIQQPIVSGEKEVSIETTQETGEKVEEV